MASAPFWCACVLFGLAFGWLWRLQRQVTRVRCVLWELRLEERGEDD